MAGKSVRVNLDYVIVAPGEILMEYLTDRGLSQAEFARRCGRSAKLISQILSGKAPIEPETALQFEKVLNLSARFWLSLESNYRLRLARKSKREEARKHVAWGKEFPVRELAKRGYFEKPELGEDMVLSLLKFFGIASVPAWQEKYDALSVAYRHSPSFKSSRAALMTWLRLGELEAGRQECSAYRESEFREAVRTIRKLTREPFTQALEDARQICNEAGVALVVVPPFPKMALSGAAWWISPRKAVIQLSGRHKTGDHLWFSWFHEAAHLLLHSKKQIFVDADNGNSDGMEQEADIWASNALISRRSWEAFIERASRFDRQSILEFSEQEGIAPGIVVGRLQHEAHLRWSSRLNNLKERLKWTDYETAY